MSEGDSLRSGEELIDENGRNATQRRMDALDPPDAPVDEPWAARDEDLEELEEVEEDDEAEV